jgi:ribose transport system substrate-binding protein
MIALAGGVALAASACSSSSGGGTTSASSSASSRVISAGSDASAAGVAAAKAQLAKYQPLVTSFKAPGPALSDPAALRGKTFTYVAAFLEAAYFQGQVQLIKQAAAVVGMKVSVCDAKGTPTGASSCIMQGVRDKSAGIITDSIPYDFASNAYAASAAANIPVVVADIAVPTPASLVGHAVTMAFPGDVVAELAADEIIDDSSGTANALLVTQDDGGPNVITQSAMNKEFAANCPACKITVVKYHETQLQQLPTLVSTAFLKDPTAKYLFFDYDSPAGPLVYQGMQTAHVANVKVVSLGAGLNGLQNISSGKQFADVNTDPASGAWNEADMLFRMITKTGVPSPDAYQLPIRAFDSSNVAGLPLTQAAYVNGEWFTNGAYQKDYERLWTS